MATSPLLEDYVDYKGHLISKSNENGGWRSAFLVIGREIAAVSAYLGVTMNLINYLTGNLHIPIATAAENVNLLFGLSCLFPLLGAFVADTYLGRYRTILFSTILGLAALIMISLSAGLSGSSPLRTSLFFFSLYLLALGIGAQSPSAQAFGADQFDETDPQGSKSRSSFFNWWYFGTSIGSITGISLVSNVQERAGWAIGFSIPCISMLVSLSIFLLGRKRYRYRSKREESPLKGFMKGLVLVARKWFKPSSPSNSGKAIFSSFMWKKPHYFKTPATILSKIAMNTREVDQIQFIYNKFNFSAAMVGSQLKEKQVEEAKAVLRLLPFFGTSLIYLLVLAQGTTFFIKQSTTMDRRIFSGYQIPATTIQSLIGLTTFISILTYDRILVPVARTLTGNPSGITMLQRIGTGMFLSMSSMVVAGLVEMKRLRTAREAGLIDLPMAMVPMSAWWMVPQTILIDVANVFAMVGLQEFVYGQVPSGLQSIALSLFSIFLGLGNFLSGLLIFMVDKLSKQRGGASWLADNLNRAHLDYFYMLLAAFSVLALGVFMALARCYVYREGRS